ncbi:uncharacterized protein [Bombus fervidus]|uniref:uncharacterized protein n=1 Tax=Bombus fervidus TaxID=203811 RepID=UPI003AB707BD
MSYLFFTLLVGAFLLLCFYLYLKHNHWKRNGIPTVKGCIPILGHLLPLMTGRMNFAELIQKTYKEYKDYSMVGMYKGIIPMLLVRDPNLVKTVLQSNFTSFHENGWKIEPEVDPLLSKNPFFCYGDVWSNGRKRLTYAFSNVRLKILFAAVTGVCKKFENFLNKQLEKNNKYEVELKSLFLRFTGEVVANAGFGIEGHCFDDERNTNTFHQLFENVFAESLLSVIRSYLPSINRFLKIKLLPKRLDQFFRNIVTENLEIRRNEPVPRNDFLQLMIDMEKTGEHIDEEVLAAHAVSFFGDGVETSSATLRFVGYDLAAHPDIQEKLRNEVLSTIAKHGDLTYEALKDMTYMNQVISESQRCHAAICFMHKVCTEEFELQGSDGMTYRAKPGTEIFISVQGLHSDPTYWVNPEVFDPERFNDERKQTIEKMTFLPFGEGPRICVGMRMAMLQMKACLATLLRNYNLQLSPKTHIPLKMSANHIITDVDDGIWAYISKLNMVSAFFTLLTGLLLLVCLYLYLRHNHWRKNGIPTVKGCIPILGHLLPLMTGRMNFAELIQKAYKEYKDYSMVGMYKGIIPMLLVRDPNLVKTVLQSNFTSFHENGWKIDPEVDPLLSKNPFFCYGDVWSNGRKRLTYAFSNVRLKILFAAVTGVCKKFENFLNKQLEKNNKYEVELKSLFLRFTGEVVANAGFGIEGHCFDDERNTNAFHQLFENVLAESLLSIIRSYLPSINRFLKIKLLPKRLDQFFRNIVTENLEIRRNEPVPRNDFLQLMIDMEKTGEHIDEEVLAAHAVSFFGDGVETSSATLRFVGYDLAAHPDIQEKLRNEVLSTIAKHGDLTYEALKDMTYMNQVISESQRCHAAICFMHKVCTEEFELQGSDGMTYRAKPGTEIFISVHGLHSDPTYWVNPEVFDPERFNDERKQTIEKMTFLPFGEGPRICIGMRMAMLQMKACLATLLRNYKLELSPKTHIPLKMSANHILSEVDDGIWAYISKL